MLIWLLSVSNLSTLIGVACLVLAASSSLSRSDDAWNGQPDPMLLPCSMQQNEPWFDRDTCIASRLRRSCTSCLYDGIQRWRTSQCADVNQRITETWCTGSILCLPCKWMQLCWPSPSYREWPRRSARCWCRSSLCARIYSLCALKFHGCQVVNTSYSSVQAKAAEAHPDGSMASELNAVNENLHIVAAFGRVFIVCREWPCTGTIHCQTACTYCNSINAGRML